MRKDIPKPKVICPECGHKEVFFHCALHDNEGDIYDWGTLVTCLNCKILFATNEMVNTALEEARKNNGSQQTLQIRQTIKYAPGEKAQALQSLLLVACSASK